MFKLIPKYKQGVLATLALLLVAVACDMDTHTAALPPEDPPPEAPAEQVPMSITEQVPLTIVPFDGVASDLIVTGIVSSDWAAHVAMSSR